MKSTPIFITAGIAASLLVGFTTGRFTSTDPQVTPVVPSAQSQATSIKTSKNNIPQRNTSSSFVVINPEQMARGELTKPVVDQNPAVVQLALAEWCRKDPEGALAFSLESERDDWVYNCLSHFGRSNPDLALKWVEENTVDLALQNNFKVAIYQGLAKDDPALAISRVNNLPQGPLRNQILQTVVAQWAETDVSSVFDWIETQEPNSLLASIYSQTMTRYISQSPEESLTLISELADNNDKQNFARKAAFELGKKDPQQVLKWAESLNDEQRHAVHMGLMEQWGKSPNAIEALKYVQELPESSETEGILSMLTMKMAYSSPDLLKRHIPMLTNEQQKIAVAQLARAYSNTTPDEIIPWIDSLTSPEVRDVAVIQSLNSFRYTNVSQAFELSTTLDSYNDRRDEVQKTLSEWFPIDPEGALNALNASSLSQDLKDSIEHNITAQSSDYKDFLLPAK
ncbi:MAG: hypothetical protein ACSHX0_01305 [Akkermansiaceae bacterium]